MKDSKTLKKEGRGAFDYKKSKEDILLVKWFDNREVIVGTNHYSVRPLEIVRRYNRSAKKYENVHCPQVVQVYNKGMKRVDRADQFLAYYRIKTKTTKWYRRVLYHFVDLSVTNSWICARQQSNIPLFEFKMEVATSLMKMGQTPIQHIPDPAGDLLDEEEDNNESDQDPKPVKHVTDAQRLDGMNHLCKQAGTKPHYCFKPGCKRRSTYFCTGCKVYLCVDRKTNCFYDFHTTK